MSIKTKQEVIEILKMPYDEFNMTIRNEAKDLYKVNGENKVHITTLLGYSNICRNQCTYCGMRAGNTLVKRYRLSVQTIMDIEDNIKNSGLKKVFLISGEDPKYSLKDIVDMVSHAKSQNIFTSLAAGEMAYESFKALKDAGLDEYVLKFETSNEELFKKIKPSTTFEKRMKAISDIKELGMNLASGGIVGFPHQSLEDIAGDIMLMYDLKISWAPIIPYMPVINTPLAKEGGRGSVETMLKVISTLRLMLPDVEITAQQPGEDIKNGLADIQGNLNALNAGANVLFVDMIPEENRNDFNVINNRMIQGLDRVKQLVKLSDMKM